MLQALTSISRARRRPLESVRAPLRLLLGGHVVLSDAGDLGNRLVLVDPIAVREIIDAVCGDDPAEVQVSLTGTYAVLHLTLVDPALAQSLHRHSGTVVEALAAGEMVLERLGGGVEVDHDGVRLWLPRADAGAA